MIGVARACVKQRKRGFDAAARKGRAEHVISDDLSKRRSAFFSKYKILRGNGTRVWINP
jgi:hypothetical protein